MVVIFILIGSNFLASLNISELDCELRDLQLARAAADELRSDDVVTEYLRSPQNMDSIMADPWSADTFNRIQDVWAALDTHNKFDRSRVVKNARYRKSIMQSHLLAWEWLDITARDRCIRIHKGQDVEAACWFDSLVKRVDTLVLTNTRSASISAAEFTSGLNVEPYQWQRRDQHAAFLPEEQESFVVEKCIDILGSWMGYDMKSVGLAQSWYLRHMVDAVGSPVLCLKRVHHGYMRLKAEIMGNRRITQVYKEDLNAFVSQLASHPLTIPNSPERVLLDNIACAVEGSSSTQISGLHTM